MQNNYYTTFLGGIVVTCGALGCVPDEVPVTGDPGQSVTQDYEQSEAVVTVSRAVPAGQIIAVAFNDFTVDPMNPLTIYSDGLEGETRIIVAGESRMGWSISEDDGMSFTYQGKVYPPTDWSLIIGDPALATGGPLLRDVYMGYLASSDVAFPPSGLLFGPVQRNHMDGFCVAESRDGGRNFPNVRCFKHGTCSISGKSCTVVSSPVCAPTDPCCQPADGVCEGGVYDGASLAADQSHVYFASIYLQNAKSPEVWRASIPGLNFARMVDLPFDFMPMRDHPRLRFGPNGRLYILSFSDNTRHVLASFLEPGSSTWSDPRKVTLPGVVDGSMVLSDRTIRLTTQFSYDFARNPETQQDELRVAVTMVSPPPAPKNFIRIFACPADLSPLPGDPSFANCTEGWNTLNTLGDQYSPNISVAGTPPQWRVTFLSRQSDPDGNQVEVRRGYLGMLFGQPTLAHFRLVAPQVPCSALGFPVTERDYWGDYNDLTHLIAPEDVNTPNPRFVAPFSRNGRINPDDPNSLQCEFRGPFIADTNVGAVVFR